MFLSVFYVIPFSPPYHDCMQFEINMENFPDENACQMMDGKYVIGPAVQAT